MLLQRGLTPLALHPRAMLITGGILTLSFSSIDMNTTPLMEWFGYNNACVYLDTAPAIYVCPVFWFVAAYLIARFTVGSLLLMSWP